MIEKLKKAAENISVENGYKNTNDMLKDYGFKLTVMTPRHKKIEIVPLIIKHILK